MRGQAIIKILGALLMFFSMTMIPPIFIGYAYADSQPGPFWIALIVTVSSGFLLWFPTRHSKTELKTRDGFLIVVLFWTVLSLFASIPLIVGPHLSFIDALFVSVSGFTTTGMSAIQYLDRMPHAILYYRQQLQFIGGMGIIVLAVAILPMIGVGGMQLYRAETPGPMKDDKLAPRIVQTAKITCFIYVTLCICCFFIYWLCGMKLFDAVCESFSTVSTGGYNIHESSFAFYQSPLIRITGIVFMALGGINFSLHYIAIAHGKLKRYWQNLECRMFLTIVCTVSIIISIGLILRNYYPVKGEAIMNGFFNTVSLMTTTGFTYGSYNEWPGFMPILLMICCFIGACGGSTSGGLKVIRLLILQKQINREVKQLIHPHAVYPLKLENKVLPVEIIQSIWAFFAVYCTIYVVIIMLLMMDGMNFTSAFGTAVASFSNTGVGIGDYAYNMHSATTLSKTICIFAMLAGRLEVFTLLVIFSRSFWRR
ncbi:MAG: TrkH family potassium uptake protein [Pseudomonadota bacterium]